MDGVLLPPSMLSEVLQSSLVNDSLTLRPISQVGVGCLTAFCLVAKNRFTLVTSVLRRLIVRSWEEETLGLREGLGLWGTGCQRLEPKAVWILTRSGRLC